MGKAAMAWALGTLRGWHEGSRPAVDTGRRLLALIVIYPGVAAAVVLGAIVLALPSLRVQTLIDEGGVHLLRPLPIFDDDRTWETVSDLKTVPAPTTQHFEGVAVVGFEAKALVRLDGIEPLILQGVGPQLVHEPDPTTLLPQVEEYPATLLRDAGQRGVQLVGAVAAIRVEHVAGKALGVDANEDRLAARHGAHRQRDVLV